MDKFGIYTLTSKDYKPTTNKICLSLCSLCSFSYIMVISILCSLYPIVKILPINLYVFPSIFIVLPLCITSPCIFNVCLANKLKPQPKLCHLLLYPIRCNAVNLDLGVQILILLVSIFFLSYRCVNFVLQYILYLLSKVSFCIFY